jgi:DNA-directed RNA polymerase subunit RPC12/RpoP
MELIIDECVECHRSLPIVNRKYWMCDDCNYKRLHKGVSKQQAYQARSRDRQMGKVKVPIVPHFDDKDQLVKALKKTFSINKISNKKAARDKEMHKTYAHIDQTREPICEGCGRGDRPLSHSHVLSQNNRPDLAADEHNIRLHCFGNQTYCHETWERGLPDEVMMMDDFEGNINYIHSVDIAAYNKIMASCEHYIETR